VKDELDDAESRGDEAFALYLSSAPKLEDSDSIYECGRQREYFGFDEDHPDDQDICDELDRLKKTPDFEDFEGFAKLIGTSDGDFQTEFPSLKPPDKRKFD
jgi:hypothetical protein